MRLGKSCSLWILALAASACVAEHKLGDEGADTDADANVGDGSAGVDHGHAGSAGQGSGGNAGRSVGYDAGPANGGSNAVGGGGPASGGSAGGVARSDAAIDTGVPPEDANHCDVMLTYYGPQPCQSNSECVTRHGAGWYCVQSDPVTDSCGRVSSWSYCDVSIDAGGVESGSDSGSDACTPMATYYGPPVCQTDADCVRPSGAWYCDHANTFADNCGNEINLPTCRERIDDGGPGPDADACMPSTYYGPRPCQTEADCVSEHGIGWYCDTTNSFPDPCGTIVTWPACKLDQ